MVFVMILLVNFIVFLIGESVIVIVVVIEMLVVIVFFFLINRDML